MFIIRMDLKKKLIYFTKTKVILPKLKITIYSHKEQPERENGKVWILIKRMEMLKGIMATMT